MSVLILAFALLTAMFVAYRVRVKLSLLSVVLLALLIRIVATQVFLPVENHDIKFRRDVGTNILAGKNIYYEPDTGHYTTFYLPLFHAIDAGALALEQFHIPQMGTLKLIFSLFDVGIVILLAKMIRDNHMTALLYALNPISVMITNVHGQSDVLAAFFLLFSTYLMQNNREDQGHIAFMFGVLAKTWPAIFIIPFLKRSRNPIRFLLIVGGAVALSILGYSLLYNVSLYQIIRPMLTYRGILGTWGITSILFFNYTDYPPLILKSFKVISTLFLAGFAYFSYRLKRENLIEEIFLIILVFFVFSPGFGAQWTVWIIPFLLLQKPVLWRTAFTALTAWIALSEAPWVLGSTALPIAEYAFTAKVIGLMAWLSLTNMLLRLLQPQLLSKFWD